MAASEFIFPVDANFRAGAVRPTANGKDFFIPAVIYGPDGVTPISSTNPLPVGIADGGNETLGKKADAAVTDPTLSASEISVLKGILKQLQGGGSGQQNVQLTGSNVVNNGQVKTTLYNSAGTEPIIGTPGFDSVYNAGISTNSALYSFNGGNLDRWRNNTEGTVLASAARTTSTSAPTQTNHNARGVLLTLDISANPAGNETLTLWFGIVQTSFGYNEYFKLDVPANSSGPFRLLIYPTDFAPVENNANRNKVVNGVVPRTWATKVNHSGTGSWTYNLTYGYIL